MRLQRIGLGLTAFDSIVYDVYSLVREGGEPLRCEGASCYRPLLDSPGWADAVAELAPEARFGRPSPQVVRYLVEGRAGSGDFTLTVKRWRGRYDTAPPPCVPVRPPVGHPRWQGV